MNLYVLLGATILAEALGTAALKLSQGFSQPLPSIGVVGGCGTAFYLLSLVLEDLPVGTTFGTWAALGIVLVTVIGVLLFDDPVDIAGGIGILLIVAGVYCLNILSEMSAH